MNYLLIAFPGDCLSSYAHTVTEEGCILYLCVFLWFNIHFENSRHAIIRSGTDLCCHYAIYEWQSGILRDSLSYRIVFRESYVSRWRTINNSTLEASWHRKPSHEILWKSVYLTPARTSSGVRGGLIPHPFGCFWPKVLAKKKRPPCYHLDISALRLPTFSSASATCMIPS